MERNIAEKIKQLIKEQVPEIDTTSQIDLFMYIESQTTDTPKIDFSEFWKRYPKKTTMKSAQERWKKLSAKNQELAIRYLQNYVMASNGYYLDPTNYLKEQRWMDFMYEAMERQKITKDDLYKQ